MASKECVHHAFDILLQLEQEQGGKNELWMSTFLILYIFSCLSTAKEDFQLAPGTLELFLFQATRSRKAREFTLERNRR